MAEKDIREEVEKWLPEIEQYIENGVVNLNAWKEKEPNAFRRWRQAWGKEKNLPAIEEILQEKSLKLGELPQSKGIWSKVIDLRKDLKKICDILIKIKEKMNAGEGYEELLHEAIRIAEECNPQKKEKTKAKTKKEKITALLAESEKLSAEINTTEDINRIREITIRLQEINRRIAELASSTRKKNQIKQVEQEIITNKEEVAATTLKRRR